MRRRRYISPISNGRGFRSVSPLCGEYRWHANVTMRRHPPRTCANRSGWSRWFLAAVARAWVGWLVLNGKRLLGEESRLA